MKTAYLSFVQDQLNWSTEGMKTMTITKNQIITRTLLNNVLNIWRLYGERGMRDYYNQLWC